MMRDEKTKQKYDRLTVEARKIVTRLAEACRAHGLAVTITSGEWKADGLGLRMDGGYHVWAQVEETGGYHATPTGKLRVQIKPPWSSHLRQRGYGPRLPSAFDDALLAKIATLIAEQVAECRRINDTQSVRKRKVVELETCIRAAAGNSGFVASAWRVRDPDTVWFGFSVDAAMALRVIALLRELED